jgi:two-component system, sensor histidine kinase and response regulator
LPLKEYSMRILLADDQKEIRLLTTHQLERSGHQVVAVGNGQEALDALEREPFDAVLMDEEMPVMSGLQALRVIRARGRDYGHIQLIALTGYNSEPDRVRLLREGFDYVLGKPFRLEALDALFREMPRRLPADGMPEPVSAAAQNPASNLLERIGGDEQLARTMIATFLRVTRERTAGMKKALEQKDGPALASLAHVLKGSVSIFGAQKAVDFAEKLQKLERTGDFQGIARVYEQLKEEIAELEANLRGYAGQRSSARSGTSSKPKRRNSGPKRKTSQ